MLVRLFFLLVSSSFLLNPGVVPAYANDTTQTTIPDWQQSGTKMAWVTITAVYEGGTTPMEHLDSKDCKEDLPQTRTVADGVYVETEGTLSRIKIQDAFPAAICHNGLEITLDGEKVPWPTDQSVVRSYGIPMSSESQTIRIVMPKWMTSGKNTTWGKMTWEAETAGFDVQVEAGKLTRVRVVYTNVSTEKDKATRKR